MAIATRKRSALRRLLGREEIGLAIFLLLSFGAFIILVPELAQPLTISDLLREISPNLIAGLGISILILQREFDVSIGSMLALVGVATVEVFNATSSIPLGVLIGLGCGVVVGAVHGYLVAYMGLNSLMTTLGTLFAIRGAVYVWTNQVTVVDEHGLVGFQSLYLGSLAGIPAPAVIALILYVAAGWALNHTAYGRAVYAVGGNLEAARALGIRIRRQKFVSFVICSTLAAVAGLVLAAQTSSGYFAAGATGFEFVVIAAVVLGGVSLSGGRGSVYGAALGVLIIGLTGKGLRLAGVYTAFELVATGVLMILAVFVYGLRDRFIRRKGSRERVVAEGAVT